VTRTRVGYCGGDRKEPTYHSMGDHTESVQVHYDPSKCSYETLLKQFFGLHDPTEVNSTQYRSAIFVHNKEQETAAQKAKASVAGAVTVIEPFKFWTDAEEYHQQYLNKKNRRF